LEAFVLWSEMQVRALFAILYIISFSCIICCYENHLPNKDVSATNVL